VNPILNDLRVIIKNKKENRNSFFRRVIEYYPTKSAEYEMIKLAYDYTKDSCRGDFRKDGKTRTFEHSRGNVLILMDYLAIFDAWMIAALLLHDNIEDFDFWALERIEEVFSRFEEGGLVVEAMERLTKLSEKQGYTKEEATRIYHQWFQTAKRWFFILKLCDRIYNLLTSEALTPGKQMEMVHETRMYYLPYARKHGILYREILAACEEIEQRNTRDPKEKKE
jgi:(p)ppGpp synthase/HD superfamily hydrolase